MRTRKLTIFLVVVSLAIMNMPCIAQGEYGLGMSPPMAMGEGGSLVTVSYPNNTYEIQCGEAMFSRGEGTVSDLQYEVYGPEVYIIYNAETPRFAWTPDGGAFIDTEVPDLYGTPKEIGDRIMAQYPELFIFTFGSVGVGGTTKRLTTAQTTDGDPAYGSRNLGPCEFTYKIWYMTGNGYDGNWIATMQTWDHDWWNSESTDSYHIYDWFDEEDAERLVLGDDGMETYPKLHFTRLPYEINRPTYRWQFNGYTGYFKDDSKDGSSWGHYYDDNRNTQGSWWYDPESWGESHERDAWWGRDTGSNFQNTQSVSTMRMEDPDYLHLHFYIEIKGYWGRWTRYAWLPSPRIYLMDPLDGGP